MMEGRPPAGAVVALSSAGLVVASRSSAQCTTMRSRLHV